jgi:hypothetical protein
MKRTAMMMAMAMLVSAGFATGQETIDVPPTSAPQGGKVIPTTPHLITDIKEGQRVQVKYHNVNGKMHATQVQVI